MNELILTAAGFAAGAALTAVVAAARLRQLSAVRDAWGRNWRVECRRHDATLRDLRQLQDREALAAANILQLSHALQDATAQAAQARGAGAPVALGADPQATLARFSRN